jgi:hypothetical protein
MQSLTYKFNASTTQLNPAWLSIFSLWIILDAEQSNTNKMCVRNKAHQNNRTTYRAARMASPQLR